MTERDSKQLRKDIVKILKWVLLGGILCGCFYKDTSVNSVIGLVIGIYIVNVVEDRYGKAEGVYALDDIYTKIKSLQNALLVMSGIFISTLFIVIIRDYVPANFIIKLGLDFENVFISIMLALLMLCLVIVMKIIWYLVLLMFEICTSVNELGYSKIFWVFGFMYLIWINCILRSSKSIYTMTFELLNIDYHLGEKVIHHAIIILYILLIILFISMSMAIINLIKSIGKDKFEIIAWSMLIIVMVIFVIIKIYSNVYENYNDYYDRVNDTKHGLFYNIDDKYIRINKDIDYIKENKKIVDTIIKIKNEDIVGTIIDIVQNKDTVNIILDIPKNIKESNDYEYMYFSSVTFFTVGYGDITIRGKDLKVIVQSEMFLAYLLVALFIPTVYGLLSENNYSIENIR